MLMVLYQSRTKVWYHHINNHELLVLLDFDAKPYLHDASPLKTVCLNRMGRMELLRGFASFCGSFWVTVPKVKKFLNCGRFRMEDFQIYVGFPERTHHCFAGLSLTFPKSCGWCHALRLGGDKNLEAHAGHQHIAFCP